MKVFVVVFAAIVVSALAKPQEVVDSVGDGEPLIESPVEKGPEDVVLRAASTFQNCDCQCDSYTWSSNGKIQGNCLSADTTGANFCYISGSAVAACRDVQISKTRTDSFNGKPKTYSYEACSTPPRNQCFNSLNSNLGDGDLAQHHPIGGIPPSPTNVISPLPPSGPIPSIPVVTIPASGSGPRPPLVPPTVASLPAPGTGPIAGYGSLGALLGLRNAGAEADEETTLAPTEAIVA